VFYVITDDAQSLKQTSTNW